MDPANISSTNLTSASLGIRSGNYLVLGTETYIAYVLYEDSPLLSYDLSIAINQTSEYSAKYIFSGHGNDIVLPSDDPFINEMTFI